MENISVNATRDFDDYLPTDEELNELKQIIRETKDLTRGELRFAHESGLNCLNLARHVLSVVELEGKTLIITCILQVSPSVLMSK